MSKTTILIETKTRQQLKEIGRKGQTYDQVLRELIAKKNIIQHLPEGTLRSLRSDEASRSYSHGQ